MLWCADHIFASFVIIVEDVVNLFFLVVYCGVEDYACECCFLTFVGFFDDDAECERDLVEVFVACCVDGFVIALVGDDHCYFECERVAGFLFVFVDRLVMWIEVDAVFSDNVGGARAVVEHLCVVGHECIVYLGDRSWLYTVSEWLSGYWEGMSGLVELILQDLIEEVAYYVMCELILGDDLLTVLFSL